MNVGLNLVYCKRKMKEETLFFAVNTKERSECEQIFSDYCLDGYQGPQAHTKLYDVCKKEKDCKYVLKVTTSDSQAALNQWCSEVDLHQQMYKSLRNVGDDSILDLYDAWYYWDGSQATFYAVLEKFDGNLMDLIRSFEDLGKSDEQMRKLMNTIINSVLMNFQGTLYYTHNICNICIRDINEIDVDCILYKEAVSGFDCRFVFSDFGITGKCTVNADPEYKKENASKLADAVSKCLPQLKFL
jgi:serine/threonine protein kinase